MFGWMNRRLSTLWLMGVGFGLTSSVLASGLRTDCPACNQQLQNSAVTVVSTPGSGSSLESTLNLGVNVAEMLQPAQVPRETGFKPNWDGVSDLPNPFFNGDGTAAYEFNPRFELDMLPDFWKQELAGSPIWQDPFAGQSMMGMLPLSQSTSLSTPLTLSSPTWAKLSPQPPTQATFLPVYAGVPTNYSIQRSGLHSGSGTVGVPLIGGWTSARTLSNGASSLYQGGMVGF